MKIWQDIEIEWQGEAYVVRPTMELVNRLEQKPGRSLTQMLMRLSNGDMPAGAACELIADTLNQAGADVSPEEVFVETSGGIDGTAITLAAQILTAILPEPKHQHGSQTAKKKQPARRKPTGEKSTE